MKTCRGRHKQSEIYSFAVASSIFLERNLISVRIKWSRDRKIIQSNKSEIQNKLRNHVEYGCNKYRTNRPREFRADIWRETSFLTGETAVRRILFFSAVFRPACWECMKNKFYLTHGNIIVCNRKYVTDCCWTCNIVVMMTIILITISIVTYTPNWWLSIIIDRNMYLFLKIN